MKILSQREQFAYRFAEYGDDEYRRHASDVDDFLTQWHNSGADSRHLYGQQGPKGTHWNRDRRAQQKQLLKDLYAKWSANAPQEGKGMIMGGLGGAGKGTIQYDPRAQLDSDRYMKIDPDEIKKEMATRGMIPKIPGLSPMEASGLVHEESSDLAKELAKRAMKEKRNLLWDITMSSPDSVLGRVNAMRKAGYGQVDGAFVDVPAELARKRVEARHRSGQERYQADQTGQEIGGRWVPTKVSQGNMPTKPGYNSKNAEVYDQVEPNFDNAIHFNYEGKTPSVTRTTGNRWHNHPLSQGGTMSLPNVSSPSNTMKATGRRRMAAEDAQSAGQPTVKDLIDQYSQGQLDFDSLVAGIAQVGHFAVEGGDISEMYQRAEELPDDNSFAQVYSAEFDDILTPDQVDAIAQALQES